jgi:hypothetical protein
LPGLTSNCNPPDLCLLSTRIIGVSHWRPITQLFWIHNTICPKQMLFFCFCHAGDWTRASHRVGRCPTTELYNEAPKWNLSTFTHL